MAQTTSPVGKLFYHEEGDFGESDVVVLGLRFDPKLEWLNGGGVTELTLLVSTVTDNGDAKVVLQRFAIDGKPTTVDLDPETLHLLSREASIMLEKRIRTARSGRSR